MSLPAVPWHPGRESEIPCPYDANWRIPNRYADCVSRTLVDAQKAGFIDRYERYRLLLSALRAYLEARWRVPAPAPRGGHLASILLHSADTSGLSRSCRCTALESCGPPVRVVRSHDGLSLPVGSPRDPSNPSYQGDQA